MADNTKQKQLEDDIPSNYINKFQSVSRETWRTDDFRNKVISIFNDHMGNEQFTNKVWSIIKDFLRNEAFSNKVKPMITVEVQSFVDKSRTKTILWVAGLIATTGAGIVIQKFFEIIPIK